MATQSGQRLTPDWVAKVKKSLIESECQGLLDFIESSLTLDDMAGSDAVKTWLREDAALLRKGALHALPMGYLVAGRIGTGKTYLVQCWAGELGIPCVVFKNFRDRWVGATESNLEKIFSVLKAIGQVLVFVDEADQAAGKREGGDGDSGLSGRVYSMLAKEMSDTRNRGRILWVFATSRPDLLEVDLKRQGRLDVHIPLFAPETTEEMSALFRAIARKLKFPLADSDLPALDAHTGLGSNEIEGVLVRALRVWELPDRAEEAPARTSSATCCATSARARTPASSNTWISWRSRNARMCASCRRASAISRRRPSRPASRSCGGSCRRLAARGWRLRLAARGGLAGGSGSRLRLGLEGARRRPTKPQPPGRTPQLAGNFG